MLNSRKNYTVLKKSISLIRYNVIKQNLKGRICMFNSRFLEKFDQIKRKSLKKIKQNVLWDLKIKEEKSEIFLSNIKLNIIFIEHINFHIKLDSLLLDKFQGKRLLSSKSRETTYLCLIKVILLTNSKKFILHSGIPVKQISTIFQQNRILRLYF